MSAAKAEMRRVLPGALVSERGGLIEADCSIVRVRVRAGAG